jgi:hypothetical protein
MDECLPRGSADAPTLRMLLEKERAHSQALEHEVARLQAGLARQNAVITALEQREADRERALQEMRRLVTAVTEQNALLRQQVATLTQESPRARRASLVPPAAPAPPATPASPPRSPHPRNRRDPSHNRGRRRMDRATRCETHAADACPRCGETPGGGWVARRVQVADLPPGAPLEVTEHRVLRRQCPRCGTRVLPPPVGGAAGRVGRCRFGPRLIAAIATMRTTERLSLRLI